jgi:hypothetical protein
MNRSGATHHGDPTALSCIDTSADRTEPGARTDLPTDADPTDADPAEADLAEADPAEADGADGLDGLDATDSGATASPRAAARTPMRAGTSLSSTGVEATQSP